MNLLDVNMRFTSYSHKFAEEVLNSKLSTKNEIVDVVNSLSFPTLIQPKGVGTHLNAELKREFQKKEWKVNVQIHPSLKLTADFRKDRVQIEAQFGNVSRYYADIFKFEVAHLSNTADIGVLMLLKRKWSNKIGSNIASFERAKQELEILKLITPMPMWILGLEP